jgi:cytoskeleton protein RodZ
MNDASKMGAASGSEAAGPTAGMLLRKAREASGLHVAALAVAMKVPVKKLEALEADRLSDLPDVVFIRALAGSMCRALKIDPAPILSRLPHSAMPKLDRDERGINTPFNASGKYYGNSVLSFVTRPAALWVIGLLCAALLVLFFPEVQTARKFLVAPIANVDTAAPSNAVALSPSGSPVPLGGVEAAVPAASAPVMAASAPGKAAFESSAAVAATPAVVPEPLPAPASELLEFRARSSAWVRVSDAKGVVQFEKTLAAGESAMAPGVPPLAIVVGNVAATELLVRGQVFNLEEVSKNNVARFEVK